jgi:hypothetical protein
MTAFAPQGFCRTFNALLEPVPLAPGPWGTNFASGRNGETLRW